jgi:hypothetical protein
MRSLFTLILSFAIATCCAQEFPYPPIIQTAKIIDEFIPAGWVIHATAAGDLNKDKINDVAIVFQYKDSIKVIKGNDPANTVITQPRMLAIFFKDADNNYTLVEQNSSFILNHDNPSMEDPFTAIKISNGFLQIDFNSFYNMGSWQNGNSSYKFQYRDKQFTLIGAEHLSIHRSSLDYEIYSYNFLTKKRKLTIGNEKKGTKGSSWKPVNITELKTFATFRTPYSWEVEPGKFL